MSNTPFTNIACRLLGHQMKPQGVTPFSVPLAMHEGRILSESNQAFISASDVKYPGAPS